MNLFGRKARTVVMCNVIVPFVCTGFLGNSNYTFVGSTTDEAHEISLTASDTEPASQYGEGEENKYAFITDGIEAIIDQQEFTGPLQIQEEENDYAFITDGIEALINQQENVLAEKKEEKKSDTKKTVKKATKKSTSTASKKTTTNVVAKKEVASNTTYEKPSTSNATGEAIVAYAKKFKGLRYKSGTPSLSSGADCSGFTMLIYREFGVSLPRTVSGQMGRGKAVSKGNLQKGDLIFYRPKGSRGGVSHVAIYIGGGQVIHETRPGRGVAITSMDGLSNIQYVGARRIINSSSAKVTETKKEEVKTDVAVNNETTPVETPNINNEEKKEVVNNNVVENKVTENNVTTTVPETPTVEEKQEVVADTPKEEVKEETPKEESKQEEKEEPKKEEVTETPVSTTESN